MMPLLSESSHFTSRFQLERTRQGLPTCIVQEVDVLGEERMLNKCKQACERMRPGLSQFRILALALVLFVGNVITTNAFLNGPSISASRTSKQVQHQPLFASKQQHATSENYLQALLQTYGYDRRVLTISSFDLPLLAEVHENGQAQICQIVSLQFDPSKDPRVQVEMGDGNTQLVDLGQVTTIWDEDPLNWKVDEQEMEKLMNQFPVGHADYALDGLYKGRVGQARSSAGLTKKQVSRLVADAPGNSEHVERVLRHVVKTGSNFARLADSMAAMESLFGAGNKKARWKDVDPRLKRAIGASALAEDAELGGRFKRTPCVLVASDKDYESLTLINGGWLVLDQSVRAGTEARKFAERESTPRTVADERIAQRLECLAMGQDFSASSTIDEDLELDVRETLKAMRLPSTPDGAKKALLRIGRWSTNGNDPNEVSINPWSQPTLQAAEWYSGMDQKRRGDMYQATRGKVQDIEDRTDLTKLPSVCIDAARTSFRDDAISVRPRSSTGRKMIEEASKWEVLIHIADVSDIYVPDQEVPNSEDSFNLLREAAISRGTSRYDLPQGPLHLMPPIALHALALETVNPDFSARGPISLDRQTTNRCVTVWAYIDERNGELLDAGLERTLISCPLALSYKSGTDLLDGTLDASDPVLSKARAVLGVAERNLKLWGESHRKRNDAAKAREGRLAVKEMVAQQINGDNNLRDDGRDGFQRSRAHRLVDSSLELYGFSMGGLLKRAKAPVPRVAGTGPLRQGRLATAPLRRYVDGMAQRQALAVLCDYGGPAMTRAECAEVGKTATKAINSISNIASMKSGAKAKTHVTAHQRKAIRALQTHVMGNNGPVPAMSTGNQGEVVIIGVGAVADCRGIRGTLKPGERVMVQIRKIDERSGAVSAIIVED